MDTTTTIVVWIIGITLGFIIFTILIRYWGWLWNYSVIKELHGIKSALKRIAEDIEDTESENNTVQPTEIDVKKSGEAEEIDGKQKDISK